MSILRLEALEGVTATDMTCKSALFARRRLLFILS